MVVMVVHAVVTPGMPILHQIEALPTQRMIGMGDPEESLRFGRIRRS